MAGRVHLWTAYFALAGIAGLAGVIAAIWMPPEGAAAVAATAAAITALPITRVSTRIDTAARQRELMSASLYAVSATGQLPRVRDLNDPIALGVHAAEPVVRDGVADRVSPFIRRDRETDVRAAITSGGFVLIVGESTAGKTRLAYEALRALRPNHAFAYPTPSGLSALLPATRKEKRCVVWLDDLERYLNAQGLTATLLAQLLGDGSRDVLIIATMRANEHHQFVSPPNEVPPEERALRERTARELLQSARTIRIDRRWSAAERERAAEHAADPRIARAVDDERFGIAETLACGPTMLMSWQNAWAPGGHPRAAAILAAAVDCRRLGMHAPVSSAILVDLHVRYLEDRGGDRLRPEPPDDALSWLCTPVHGATGSLLISSADGYQAFDYLLDVPDQQPVPEGMPFDLASRLDPVYAHDVGRTLGRLGRWEEAHQVHCAVAAERERLLGADHPDTLVTRYEVAYALGRLGRWEEALALYLRVAEAYAAVLGAEHPATLDARYEIGISLGRLGRRAEALEQYRELVAARTRSQGPTHPETLRARHSLGISLGRLGHWDQALAEARQVWATRAQILGPNHPDTLVSRREIAVALGWLGHWNQSLAEYRQVRHARERVLGAGHPDSLRSYNDEAHCLERLGRAGEAVELYRRVTGLQQHGPDDDG